MSVSARVNATLFACFLLLGFEAAAWERGHVDRFATLPARAAAPEGITVDRHGNVYVTTFAAGPGPFREENLYVFDSHGDLRGKVKVAGSSANLLGLGFNPVTHQLLVADIGMGRVWNVNPKTGEAAEFAVIPDLTPNDPNTGPGPNALAFDGAGNVYISDSFQATIWKTGPAGGAPTAWAQSPLLGTSGVPPFGANGLDFNSEGVLLVANTGNDTLVRIPMNMDGSAGPASVFVNSVNGADGLFVDEEDNIWVCANQADEIVVVDRTGKAIAKLGDFEGVRRGSPVGLLFPASLARDGNWIYVTNLSLDLRLFSPDFQTVDSQWAEKVMRHTVSRIRARIPRRHSDD
jgi:sugar lactone lactonase YvrE